MKKLLMTAAVAMIFAACSKKDKSTDTNNPPPQPQSKLLKRITKTEDGHTTIFSMVYDANKRLVSYNSDDQSETLVFTYDGSGNLIGTDERDNGLHNVFSFTYSNGVPVSGSFKSFSVRPDQPEQLQEEDKYTYAVENGLVTKILMHQVEYNQDIPLTITYKNGNVTQIRTEGYAAYTASFTYGNKQSGIPQVYKYVLDQAGFAVRFFSRNEVLSENYDFPGTDSDVSTSATYTYDSNGYVLTSVQDGVKLLYEYN